ncbi:MAG TPA: C39 family peptidase [Nocardioides sp.]|nr:C39 family peptidase [Nocardioides sp.]
MPRPRTIAIGAFALLLAATPFIPRGGGDDASLRPSGQEEYGALAATAGAGRVTPDLQAEIDRVVAEGLAVGRLSGKQTTDALAAGLVRCADFEGQRYCLNSGWTEATQTQVQARTAVAARTIAARPSEAGSATGDLDVLATLRRQATLSPTARATAERAELTRAARSVAKVWLLRHQVEGVPLPDGFLERHPEARASAPVAARSSASASPSPTPTTTTTRTRVKHQIDYPERRVILRPRHTAEQRRTYWCGPTTMQMIAWGWQDERKGQGHWADKLGTTSNGTAISDMVRVVNSSTGWDRRDHAGPYITLDIGDYSFRRWTLLTMRHIVDYRAPLVLHPVLRKRYYPYLDDDASGHFQVGRGYDKRGDKPTRISYFEPWNQQRFDPSEPFIGRLQWRSAYKSYRANEAHFQHNIGV